MVAIYSQPAPVNLFQFFWRELKLIGARAYEAQDFEKALALAASGSLPLEEPTEGFREMERGGAAMKILVRCSE